MRRNEKMTLRKYINKQHSNDRREAKLVYKARLREARATHKIRMEEYYLKTGAARPIDPPYRPILEEVGNSVTHGLGSIFAIVAFVLMLLASDTAREYVSASIYFFGMFTMFTVSCLYHALPHGGAAKRLFRRFDYSSIYLLIGATFAPTLACVFTDTFGLVFFIIQWAVITMGITLVGVYGPSKLRYIHIPLYVVLGWSALMLLPRMITFNFPLGMWILAGGVIYSIGIVPYVLKTKVSHFVWHFFVLAGAVVQWIGIYFYLYLA